MNLLTGTHRLRRAAHFISSKGALALTTGLLAACSSSNTVPANSVSAPALLSQKIQHVIVIYQENWSFDAVYANYPGANGVGVAGGANIPQVQWGSVNSSGQCVSPSYVSMAKMTQQPLLGATNNSAPWPCGWVDANGNFGIANVGGSNPDPAWSSTFANGGGIAVGPFSLTAQDPPTSLTGDITHVFWHQQLQIDNGTLETPNGSMDKFVAYSSNPGYVFSQYDATSLPVGKIARHYVMADNFFHSAFGGSFLNHQWLICACTPVWNQALPTSNTTTFESFFNPATKSFVDSNVTLMPKPQAVPGPQSGTYYDVNTTQPANPPFAPGTASDPQIAPIPATVKTIGDLMTDASPTVSWAWYSGDWNAALQTNAAANVCFRPSVSGGVTNSPPGTGDCFQFHHQPFNYYARWSSDPVQKAAHLQDESNFLTALQNNALPAVSFIKPVGVNNEHPNYSELATGQAHVQMLMQAICNSPYWQNSVVIITYDENGGRWDHVVPPVIDQWGPGTRVPAIIASPYAKAGYVDHTQYETVSILSFIEQLFGLPHLGTRDTNANPLSNAFNFSQQPLSLPDS